MVVFVLAAAVQRGTKSGNRCALTLTEPVPGGRRQQGPHNMTLRHNNISNISLPSLARPGPGPGPGPASAHLDPMPAGPFGCQHSFAMLSALLPLPWPSLQPSARFADGA